MNMVVVGYYVPNLRQLFKIQQQTQAVRRTPSRFAGELLLQVCIPQFPTSRCFNELHRAGHQRGGWGFSPLGLGIVESSSGIQAIPIRGSLSVMFQANQPTGETRRPCVQRRTGALSECVYVLPLLGEVL